MEGQERRRKDTRRYSQGDLKAMGERGDYVPTKHDAPVTDIDEDYFWKNAAVVMPPSKSSVHLRVNTDVLE